MNDNNSPEDSRAVQNGMSVGEYLVWTEIASKYPSDKPYHVDVPVSVLAELLNNERQQADTLARIDELRHFPDNTSWEVNAPINYALAMREVMPVKNRIEELEAQLTPINDKKEKEV